MVKCPLCLKGDTALFFEGEGREYHLCKYCDLVFVPSEFFLDRDSEKQKYDNHNNSPEDKGYRNFLDKLLIPLSSLLSDGSKGLDFGSGPGPTLSVMMEKRGFEMDIYDPFYAPNSEVFSRVYDFVTMTEVIEHMHYPQRDLKRVWRLIGDGGFFGVMTAFRVEDFENWYYKRDLTHVLFWSRRSFEYLSALLGAKIVYMKEGVVILKKERV
jgi:SAM-dependent methyltransferase